MKYRFNAKSYIDAIIEDALSCGQVVRGSSTLQSAIERQLQAAYKNGRETRQYEIVQEITNLLYVANRTGRLSDERLYRDVVALIVSAKE